MVEQVQNINPSYPSHRVEMPLMIKPIVQLIEQHAISVVWEQAMRCPCVDISTGQPMPNCPVCHGQGWLYLHPRSLDMALQSDNKKFSLNATGQDQMGTTLATPQITVNSVEQGIKPGDRITVSGWTTTENYVFNINQQRLRYGLFLPYKVTDINEAYVIEDNKLKQIDLSKFALHDNWLSIEDRNLLNVTISLSLEIVKRFYVVALNKELRYQTYSRLADKQWATGNGTNQIRQQAMTEYKPGNDYIDNGNFNSPDITQRAIDTSKIPYSQVVKRDGKVIVPGKHQIYRLPPLLLLRRENLYFSNLNLVTKESDNHAAIRDPRVSDFNEFLGTDE